MLDYFPEYLNLSMDEEMGDVTIRHLLTMQMGIDSESEEGYALYNQVYRSLNWIQTTLELPLVFSPGENFRYNTFETHLLSAIITKATEQTTLKYAEDNLCRFLGINIDEWQMDPQGYYFGGNSMHFTPREMATLGLLYLNGGNFNGMRVVPSSWVDLSLTKTWGNDGAVWGVLTDYNYGYLWWLGKINGYKLYMALGYGGQTVLIFPEIDLIVVTTAKENVASANEQEMAVLTIVSNYVMNAVNN
jgi:CubicO group peptidase (beta-lactamase class C family)